jgi:dienelactone hydrolase
MGLKAAGTTIAGVPALVAVPQDVSGAPVVLWFHGFRADALAHAGELERCAALGWLAIGVDAVDHGARRATDLDERVVRDGALAVLRQQVDATIDELPAVLGEATRRWPVNAQRVTTVGVSMGAMLVYRAVRRGVPSRAAVALLGTPEWPDQATVPVLREDVALLSITAEHDVNVSPRATAALHAALDERGGAVPPHRHHVLRGEGHLTSAPAWEEAMQATRAWMVAHG